uniref:Maturase K n=1 Tax=Mesocestoides corti TaxID=53468 RepID=A0A5K3G1E8_MESCO
VALASDWSIKPVLLYRSFPIIARVFYSGVGSGRRHNANMLTTLRNTSSQPET